MILMLRVVMHTVLWSFVAVCKYQKILSTYLCCGYRYFSPLLCGFAEYALNAADLFTMEVTLERND